MARHPLLRGLLFGSASGQGARPKGRKSCADGGTHQNDRCTLLEGGYESAGHERLVRVFAPIALNLNRKADLSTAS